MSNHFTEEIVQQLALGIEPHDPALTLHLKECNTCSTAVENYKAIFAATTVLEKPVFEFDAVQLVLPQLPAPAVKTNGSLAKTFVWILTISIIVFAPFVLANKTIINLFEGVSIAMLGIILVATMVIVAFLFREITVSYKEKIQQLNLY